MAETWRATEKAHRRKRYLTAAAKLFAERGFNGVSIEDLGAAVGVRGPALYRHFSSKEAILSELLIGSSERLLEGFDATLAEGLSSAETMRNLITFHVDFALSERDTIRLQDRELSSLPAEANKRVRSLQRRYFQGWVAVGTRLRPYTSRADLEVVMHAVFGVLNSTQHNADLDSRSDVRTVLTETALAALVGTVDDSQLRSVATDLPAAT